MGEGQERVKACAFKNAIVSKTNICVIIILFFLSQSSNAQAQIHMDIQSAEALTALIVTIGGLIWGSYALWQRRIKQLAINLINAKVYVYKWSSFDVQTYITNPNVVMRPNFKEGDCRRTFTVIEFEISNKTESEISVTEIVINDWIYANRRISEGPVGDNQDYRVFDLYTKEEVNLQDPKKIGAGEILGIRLEILHETFSPEYVSTKHRYVIPITNDYIVRVKQSTGKWTNKNVQCEIHDYFHQIGRWSDLLGEPSTAYISDSVRTIRNEENKKAQSQYKNRLLRDKFLSPIKKLRKPK